MSRSIGVLTLDLVARTVEYDRNLQRSENQTKTSGNAMTQHLHRVEVQSQSTGESMVALGNKVKAAAAAFAVGHLVNYADNYTQMAARVKNATSSLTEYQQVQEHLYTTSNGTFRALAEAQEVFLASFDGLKQAGYNTKQILAITDSLSYSYVHNSASVDKAAAATAAYGKVIDKNKVEADAWYSLIAAAPNLINDISKASGKSATEIRELGATGKITADQLHQGLMKARDANQALADNMSNSLADGARVAANAIQKYTGDLNMNYGVTAKAAEVFAMFAENIELVAKTGVVIAIGAITTATAKKTIAINGEITASIAARQAVVAQTAAQVEALGVETLRARQHAAMAATELNLARAEYNTATSATARAAAIQRVTSAEIAYNIASRASTQATAAYTAAQTAATAATNGLARAKAMALGIMGGPVGLGVAVASVAAGYLLLSNNTKEHTGSLRENNVSVADAIEKYRELSSVQQAGQMAEERKKLQELQNEYAKTETALAVYASGMNQANEFVTQSQVALAELFNEYKKTGDLEKFNSSVQASGKITQKAKDEIAALATNVNNAGDAAKTQKQFIENIGTAIKKTGDEAKQSKAEIVGMSKELQKLLSDNKTETYKNNFIAEAVNRYNIDAKHAEMIYTAREAAGILGTTKQLSNEALVGISKRFESESRLNAILDERNKKLKSENDQLAVNAKVRANADKYNFAGLESNNGLPSGLLSAVQMQESRGDTYRNGKLLTSPAGAKGSFQFMDATAKRFNVNVEDMASSAAGAAKYLGWLIKRYDGNIEKAVMAYNAGEGNVDSGKAYGFKETKGYVKNVMGYMGGQSGLSISDVKKAADDYLKIQQEQAESRKQIELDVANEVTRIKSELTAKVAEIEKAGFAPARQKELIAEYTARADNEIAVAQQALQTKLDDFNSYLLTEEQQIKQSYARRQFDVQHDLDLTKDQRKQASEALRQQMVNELELNRIAEEKSLLQIKQKWMDSGEYASQYYQLVRDEILATASYTPEQKEGLIRQANSEQGMAQNAKRESVWDDYQDRFGAQKLPYQNDLELLNEAHAQMLISEQEYQQQRVALQTTYGADYLTSFAGMMQGMVSETSTAYAVLGGIQKGAALFSTIMNSYTAISAAWASAPFPANLPAVAMATMETGLLQAAVSALSPTGYATGGLVRGPGTGTSDSINARLSDKEYVINAASVQKIGVPNLDYLNRTGQLPAESNALQPAVGGGIGGKFTPSVNVQPNINVNPNLVIVDDRSSVTDHLYSADGEKAFLYHYKRNKSKLGA